MGAMDDFGDEDDVVPTRAFDLSALAGQARPREVTGATFSYVDALLAGKMSQDELARIRDDIMGGEGSARVTVDPIVHVQGLMGARDWAGALHAAEELLEKDPAHPTAASLAHECRERQADLYQPHVGAGHDIPRLAIPMETLGEHGLDRWAAYLISRMDGSTIDELVDLTGFSRLDTLRLLYELLQRGVIVVDRRTMTPSSGGPAVIARVNLKRST